MKFTNTITDENGRLIDVRVEEVADKRRGGGLQESNRPAPKLSV
jgi:hypothetical protein